MKPATLDLFSTSRDGAVVRESTLAPSRRPPGDNLSNGRGKLPLRNGSPSAASLSQVAQAQLRDGAEMGNAMPARVAQEAGTFSPADGPGLESVPGAGEMGPRRAARGAPASQPMVAARFESSAGVQLSDARSARDAGIAQAETSELWDGDAADAAFEAYCRANPLIFADDFHQSTGGKFVHRAFGGVMKRALATKKIAPTPETRPSIQSQMSRRTVYRSLIVGTR